MTYTRQDYRKFGGETFTFDSRYRTKSNAKRKAAIYRRSYGLKVRIVKVKSDKTTPWYLYTGKKKRRRSRRK